MKEVQDLLAEIRDKNATIAALTDKLTKATTALADALARVKELESLLRECAPALDDNYVLGWAPTLPERIRAADRSAMATKKD